MKCIYSLFHISRSKTEGSSLGFGLSGGRGVYHITESDIVKIEESGGGALKNHRKSQSQLGNSDN